MVYTPEKTITDNSTSISVVKRCGTRAPLDITRIRDVVSWACKGLDANPIELESGLKMRLKDGVTTREIQENLIQYALEMCSPEEPAWRYVAGRLHIWSLWKDTLVERGSRYGEYGDVVSQKVAAGVYDERLLEYSLAELDEAGWWINADWDLDYDYAGAVLLTKRYLLEQELPQEAFLTCALLLALPEKPENRLKWARKFYEAIATRKVSLATPILANLRIPNGSLSSCFPAQTPVMTKGGFKPIEDIDVGDVVLTHENRYRTVLATNQRLFDETTVTIKVNGLDTVVTATDNHTFLVMQKEEVACERAGMSCLTNQGSSEKCLSKPRHYKSDCSGLRRSFSPRWIEARNLKPGDWMQIPFCSEISAPKDLLLSDYVDVSYLRVIDGLLTQLTDDDLPNEQLNRPSAVVPIDNDFMLLLGYYLAEGYASKSAKVVSLTFNSKSTDHIDEAAALFESIFQVKPVVEQKKDNSTCVKLHSKWVAQFFVNLVGTGFNTKILPKEIMLADPSLQRSLLKGVFRGDGCATENRLRLTLCNRLLIDQLFEICLREKLSPSMAKATRGKLGTEDPYNLTLTFSQNADFILEVGRGLDKFKAVKTVYKSIWHEGKFYRSIREVHAKSLKQEAMVYDLQVAEDSSFCTGRMAAHNCFIIAMEDNLESIYREITNAARISKNGGGVGCCLSNIRATGATVMGHKNASGGVIPWIKLLNDTAIAVNQGGRRAGAITTALDIWHLDVPEFLEMQSENGKLIAA